MIHGDEMKVKTGDTVLKRLLRSNECEFVSLGYNCDVAHFLRYSGLRKKAYPFDWCVTPNESIVRLIENGFSNFLDVRKLTFSEPHKALFFEGEGDRTVESDKVVVTAYCSEYGMSFPHDFSDEHDRTYQKVSDKYNDRIARLMDLMKSDKNVIFIFKPEVGIDYEVFVERIDSCLTVQYPSLKFHVYPLDDLKKLIDNSIRQSFVMFIKRKAQRINQMLRRALNGVIS